MRLRVSVIVPVWRDADPLRTLLADPVLAGADEIVVAATADEAEELAALCSPGTVVRLVTSKQGRAAQMNAGARNATGDWLLFLHADSRLPPGWNDEIAAAAADTTVVGGAFGFALDSSDPRARFMEWGVRQRIRLFDLPYGDQGLFVRRSTFEALGGYRDMPLMEDVDFVRRLRQCGRLRHSLHPVITSARRWERDGWFRRMGANWALMTAYSFGIDPRTLSRWYTNRSAGAIAVLARDPASAGKTRLWRALGMPPDPALARALLTDTMNGIPHLPGLDRLVVHTGPRSSIASCCPPGWSTTAQRGTDLGDRMACAFEDLFSLGHTRVFLIGSDLPTLPGAAVHAAVRALRRGTDLVLGPAADGGYYLVGLRAPRPELFRDIDWGTPRVLEQTTARAQRLGLTVQLVTECEDVDGPDSLRRAAADPRAVHTAEWCRARSIT